MNFTRSPADFQGDTVTSNETIDSSKSVFDNDHGDLTRYGEMVVLVVGCLGNVISFITMVTKDWRRKSSAVYMATLAITDTLSLVALFNEHYMYGLYGNSIPGLFSLCNWHILLYGGSLTASAWLLVGVTFDRVIAVFAPIKSRLILTPRRAGIVVAFLLVCCYGIYAYALVAYKAVPLSKICPIRDGNVNWYSTGGLFLVFVTAYCFMPGLIIILLNLLIVVQLNHRTVISAAKSGSASDRLIQKTTVMVVVISMAFVLLAGPNNVITIFIVEKGVKLGPTRKFHNTVLGVIELFNVANHAVNFFLYVACSSNFRRSLRALLPERCCTCPRDQEDGEPETGSSGVQRESSVY